MGDCHRRTLSISRLDDGRLEEHQAELWGSLIPCSSNNPCTAPINLLKTKPQYSVGYSPQNDLAFPRCPRISKKQCIIEWDGDDGPHSVVKVTDLSNTGTYINGKRVGEGKNRFMILRDGNVISFGSGKGLSPVAKDDYRFIYRQVDNRVLPARGLHKSYDLERCIGQGAFSTVVKALHRQEGKWYAVKMIPVHSLRRSLTNADRENGVRTTVSSVAIREIQILERLQHEHICQLREAFLESGRLNLILEYAKYGNLLEYIKEFGVIFEHQGQPIAYQICDAVAYIHSMGIAHRDLKLENVLLSERVPVSIMISDFGLSKAIDTGTQLRSACGTPAYAAPEVFNPNAKGYYDNKVDSWSIGVIVYAMLTMRFPFYMEDIRSCKKLNNQMATCKVDRSTLADFNVSTAGQDFICRLLTYEPHKRATVSQACDDPWLFTPKLLKALSVADQHSLYPLPAPSSAPIPSKVDAPGAHRTGAELPGHHGSLQDVSENSRPVLCQRTRVNSADLQVAQSSSMSMSIALEQPVSARTRGKQKVLDVPNPAEDEVPGLNQPRRSKRLAEKAKSLSSGSSGRR